MAREKTFRFKQFEVVNDRTAMKVGTDGVLLGAWCNVHEVKSALDVGTGCGLIALMIAQRTSDCIIDCIDIDHDAVEEALINIENSPWRERINSLVADFKQFKTKKKYDLIVSNPPFFSHGVEAPMEKRKIARQTVELSFEQLITTAIPLLTDSGNLCIITPADSQEEITTICESVGAYIQKRVTVFSKPAKAPIRCLWEISARESSTCSSELFIHDSDGKFTKQYVDICSPFYLKM